MVRSLLLSLFASVAMLLAACGGGGSDAGADAAGTPGATGTTGAGDPPVFQTVGTGTASFQSPALLLTLAQGESEYQMEFRARVTEVTAPLFVFVQADQQVVKPGLLSVSTVGVDEYSAVVSMNRSLPPGNYQGNFVLLLCYDEDCHVRHAGSGALLPYDVTITPALSVTMTVNGTPVSLDVNAPTLDAHTVRVHSGDTIAMHSSVPFAWSSSPNGALLANQAQAGADMSATVMYASTVPGGSYVDLFGGDPNAGVNAFVRVLVDAP